MKIKLNVDTIGYKQKPVEYYGAIRNRLYTPDRVTELDPDELAAQVEQGKSFTAAVMEQTNRDGWRAQQLLIVDIDNDTTDQATEKKRCIACPLRPEEALQTAEQYFIRPCFMYYTFSNTPAWPRFRMVFVLDRPITDKATAADLGERLTAIFNEERKESADAASGQIDRMFAGSLPGSVFYKSGAITKLDALEALPPIKRPAEIQIKYRQPEKILHGPLADLEAQVEAAIDNFDLAGYIITTTAGKAVKRGAKEFINPCPICGHNDCFNVTGGLYSCFSSSHPGTTAEKPAGGTIIQYLQEARGLDYGEARDIFKYEILRQNPEEWKAAYRETKQMEEKARAAEVLEKETPEETATDQEPATRKSVMERFLDKVQSEAYRPYQTGLSFFDRLLDGGVMRQTLLLLLAPQGIGKTTLCQQIAESIAASGKPVVYFNLEMSREQLIAKGISARIWRKKGKDPITALDILQGYKWTPEQRDEILEAAEAYEREILTNLTYAKAGISVKLDALREYLDRLSKEAKEEQREAPAVILDYLHLIEAPQGQRMEVQELLKQTTKLLKDYATANDTFALAICATNRDSNKSGRVNDYSGRDSSNIEYTGDQILTLNYQEVYKKTIDPGDDEAMDKLRQRPWQKMVLHLGKSRLTSGGRSAELYFYPAGSTFYDAHGWLPADAERVPFWLDEPTERKAEKQKRY